MLTTRLLDDTDALHNNEQELTSVIAHSSSAIASSSSSAFALGAAASASSSAIALGAATSSSSSAVASGAAASSSSSAVASISVAPLDPQSRTELFYKVVKRRSAFPALLPFLTPADSVALSNVYPCLSHFNPDYTKEMDHLLVQIQQEVSNIQANIHNKARLTRFMHYLLSSAVLAGAVTMLVEAVIASNHEHDLINELMETGNCESFFGTSECTSNPPQVCVKLCDEISSSDNTRTWLAVGGSLSIIIYALYVAVLLKNCFHLDSDKSPKKIRFSDLSQSLQNSIYQFYTQYSNPVSISPSATVNDVIDHLNRTYQTKISNKNLILGVTFFTGNNNNTLRVSSRPKVRAASVAASLTSAASASSDDNLANASSATSSRMQH